MIKVTDNVAQYPLHNAIYAPAKFEVATFTGLGGNTFTRNTLYDFNPKPRSQNVAQNPPHHATYVTAKSEVATSNGFRGDAFTRIYTI